MKIVRFNDTEQFTDGALTAREYPHEDPDFNIASIEINGRYPAEGRLVNERSKEIVYVVEGAIAVEVEGERIMLEKGDAILIHPGEKIFWEGNASLIVPASPAWTKEQHKMVD
jgi:quercetin dioxygenase-like cupin family protein